MAQRLGQVAPGTLVTLHESGSPVQFYVSKQNYESGLNGTGRVLMVRNGKATSFNGDWENNNINAYANSTIDIWFNTTYKALLDPWVQNAIGTTTFKYTPGNGKDDVTTLTRSVFALSLTELGISSPALYNVEGSVLPVPSLLYVNGSWRFWTRTPVLGTKNSVFTTVGGTPVTVEATSAFSYCPCFTLSATLWVWDDGSVNQMAPAPAAITTPALVMMGNTISLSWNGVEGADHYILQRKADAGEWEQVYSGADTTFTDTAGSWSTVQYQVCGVFDGTNGAFAVSDVIAVAPASTLVISGQDGELGTITADIPYSVATDTGRQIALTQTVNGALVYARMVDSGFSGSIPVLDLPTGTGTIVIMATVQTDRDPVTVTRTWTYTKQAQTFPASGGVGQLTQDGQNVFPLTLAEAVKAIGGPWGGNLSTALDKLAKAATYTTAGDFADLWGNIIPTVKIETGSYVGTGASGSSSPNKLSFSFQPKVVFITGYEQVGSSFYLYQTAIICGNPIFSVTGILVGTSNPPLGGYCNLTLKENTISWWAHGYFPTGTINLDDIQLNANRVTYHYVAFG